MTEKSYTLIDPEGTKTELPVRKPTLGPNVLEVAHLYGERGVFTFDPGFAATASCESAITYIDGEAGRAAVPRLPDRAARRGLELHRSLLSAAARRAADPGAAHGFRPLDPHAHDDQRVVAAILQRLSPQRASDGDGLRRGRVDVRVLSRQHRHPESAGPRHVRAPHHREAADDRGRRLQALARSAVRLSAEQPRLLHQPAAHVLRRAVGRVLGEPGRGGSARPPVHPARRPRAELQHLDRAARGQLGHEPLLGDRGRHVGALGAGARRRERSRDQHARANRPRERDRQIHRDAPRTRTTRSA